MKRTKHNLNDMLRLVRENGPAEGLFSSTEVQKMIEHKTNAAPNPQHGLDGRASFITTYRTQIIMLSITTLIVTGALLFPLIGTDPVQHTTTDIRNAETQSLPPNTDARKQTYLPLTRHKTQKLSGRTEKEKHGTLVPDREIPERDTLIYVADRIAGAVISGLTPEELQRIFGIGFVAGRTEIQIEDVVQTSIIPSTEMQAFREYGYDTTASTIYLRSLAVIELAPGSVMGNTTIVGPQPNRLIASPVGIILFNEKDNPSSLTMSLASDTQMARVGAWSSNVEKELMELSDTKKSIASESVLNRLIAIRVPHVYREQDGRQISRDIVVWYVPTPYLVAALPARYRTPQLIALAKATYVRQEKPRKRIVLSPGVQQYRSYTPLEVKPRDENKLNSVADINGIKFLDLTKSEMERIGVTFTDSGLSFPMEQLFSSMKESESLSALGYDISAGNQPIAAGFVMTADTFSTTYTPLPQSNVSSGTLKPVLYSGHWIEQDGNRGMYMIFTTRSPQLNLLGEQSKDLQNEVLSTFNSDDDDTAIVHYTTLNKLIPVRFALESTEYVERAEQHRGGEVILWYVPTPEFVGALPDRYRIPLERELQIIASVEDGTLPPGEVCRQMAGEDVIMDVCRSGSGAISYTRTWPNPASDNLTVHFALTEPRRVGITLHDLTGRFLQELTNLAQRSPGTHQERISLDGVESGTYLLTIRTDKGEQAVQRIVVNAQ